MKAMKKAIRAVKKAGIAALLYATVATGCATKPKEMLEFAPVDMAPAALAVDDTIDAAVEAPKPKYEITAGYNALETAVTYKDGEVGARNRLLVNFGVGNLQLHVLYDLNDLDPDTSFVIARPAYQITDSTELETKIKANADGILDAKFGVRDTHLPKMLGGYGFTELVANNEMLDLTVFYGRNLVAGFSLEGSQSVFIPFDDDKDVKFYNELQLNYELNKNVKLFARFEVSDFEFDKADYMVGFTILLK